MSLSDPIGDMLARIKNAQMRNQKNVDIPSSKFKTKIADVLKRIEKHEESCDKRYERIQKQLDRLDMKVWGLAVLIIFAPLVHKMF